MITDPVERIIAEGLTAKGIRFIHDGNGVTTEKHLDFYLPDYDVYIECKQAHSDRSSEQLKRHPNIILIQGLEAARFFSTKTQQPEEIAVKDTKQYKDLIDGLQKQYEGEFKFHVVYNMRELGMVIRSINSRYEHTTPIFDFYVKNECEVLSIISEIKEFVPEYIAILRKMMAENTIDKTPDTERE